jgi:hypothetical protein
LDCCREHLQNAFMRFAVRVMLNSQKQKISRSKDDE